MTDNINPLAPVKQVNLSVADLPDMDEAGTHRIIGEDALTLVEDNRVLKARLSDPIAVHANMLRGTIAKPTVEQIIHLYGREAFQPMIDAAVAKALEDACLAVSEHADWPEDKHGRTEQVGLFARVINAIAAIPPAKQEHVADSNAHGVEVKPLVWEDTAWAQSENSTESALSQFGRYYVQHGAMYWGPGVIVSTGYPTLDAAKAAAQADYEARIMAALEPAPTAAGAREAALMEEAVSALRTLLIAADAGTYADYLNAIEEGHAILALIDETRA